MSLDHRDTAHPLLTLTPLRKLGTFPKSRLKKRSLSCKDRNDGNWGEKSPCGNPVLYIWRQVQAKKWKDTLSVCEDAEKKLWRCWEKVVSTLFLWIHGKWLVPPHFQYVAISANLLDEGIMQGCVWMSGVDVYWQPNQSRRAWNLCCGSGSRPWTQVKFWLR